MSNSSIRPKDRTLSDATTPGAIAMKGYTLFPNSNEGVHLIPQNSSITGASPSDSLISYPGHLSEEGSYPSAEKKSVHSTVPPPPQPTGLPNFGQQNSGKNSFIWYALAF